jgi:hypothetical protein
MTNTLRIANCSGFYGDRLSAAREMVEGGPIDVLTGDYLAELTLLILLKDRFKDANLGYARTFLRQLEEVAARCLERGIKIVVNAGGLNPAGCAAAARAVYEKLGLRAVVAHVEGDDLMPRLDALQAAGERFVHLDKGTALADLQAPVMSANAYLGGFGIAAALEGGADVVICPRVTDAALVVGPAAWRFQWKRADWDALAGAVVAGHIIECGAQCTGGNYAFFDEVPRLHRPGFPIAEVRANGSCVITKHPGTDGLVSVGTVTAQLLYEIGGPAYANPDVTARFDTIAVEREGRPRPRAGARGEPPPPTTKVCIKPRGRLEELDDVHPRRPRHRGQGAAGRGDALGPGRRPRAVRRVARHAPPRRVARIGQQRRGLRVSHGRRPRSGSAEGRPPFPVARRSRWRSRAIPASPALGRRACVAGRRLLAGAGRIGSGRASRRDRRGDDRRAAGAPAAARGAAVARGCPPCRRYRPDARALCRSVSCAGPARATRAATPTSGCGCARRPHTRGWRRS